MHAILTRGRQQKKQNAVNNNYVGNLNQDTDHHNEDPESPQKANNKDKSKPKQGRHQEKEPLRRPSKPFGICCCVNDDEEKVVGVFFVRNSTGENVYQSGEEHKHSDTGFFPEGEGESQVFYTNKIEPDEDIRTVTMEERHRFTRLIICLILTGLFLTLGLVILGIVNIALSNKT